MVRASSTYRICTNRPVLNDEELEFLERELQNKVEVKLKEPYSRDFIDRYCNTAGLKTIATSFKKYLDKRAVYEQDDLPDGAKTYLHELWLENNFDFYTDHMSSEGVVTRKGTLAEDDAILVLNAKNGTTYKKNIVRKTKGFLSGECDIVYEAIIGPSLSIKGVRDIKVPKDWKSFKSKCGIPDQYKWQLTAYCYLEDATEAGIDYIFMPVPDELIPDIIRHMSDKEIEYFKKTEEAISNLTPDQRVKSFELNVDLKKDIEFLKGRLDKAETYYNSLTYEICMNLNTY